MAEQISHNDANNALAHRKITRYAKVVLSYSK